MALPDRTNTHRRVSLSAAAAVIAALAVAMAGASVAAPMGASAQRPTRPGASSGPGIPFPGFVRDRGRYAPLVVPGAVTQTFPTGINDRGQIVGYYDDAGGVRGFLRQKDGRYSRIEIPGAQDTEAFDINERGQIVGSYSEFGLFRLQKRTWLPCRPGQADQDRCPRCRTNRGGRRQRPWPGRG